MFILMFLKKSEVLLWVRGSCTACFCPAGDDVVIQIVGLVIFLATSAYNCEVICVCVGGPGAYVTASCITSVGVVHKKDNCSLE